MPYGGASHWNKIQKQQLIHIISYVSRSQGPTLTSNAVMSTSLSLGREFILYEIMNFGEENAFVSPTLNPHVNCFRTEATERPNWIEFLQWHFYGFAKIRSTREFRVTWWWCGKNKNRNLLDFRCLHVLENISITIASIPSFLSVS